MSSQLLLQSRTLTEFTKKIIKKIQGGNKPDIEENEDLIMILTSYSFWLEKEKQKIDLLLSSKDQSIVAAMRELHNEILEVPPQEMLNCARLIGDTFTKPIN